MKRIIQIAAAVMLGSLLAAPSLFAQTLTSKTEYWDYWRTRISSKYTVLPNGEKHGQQYLYDKSGTLRESNMWDKGTRKSLVRYYENGRPQIKAKIVTKLTKTNQNSLGLTPILLNLQQITTSVHIFA